MQLFDLDPDFGWRHPRDMGPQQLRHPGRILVGNQPEAELGHGVRR